MNSKYYPMIKQLRSLSVMWRRVVLPIRLLRSGFWKSESYYPEVGVRKSKYEILCELMAHIWKYGTIEYHYFSYGLDIDGFRDRYDYLDDGYFLWKTAMLNSVTSSYDYTCILRDKELFADLLTSWGFNTPHVVCDSVPMCAEDVVSQLFANTPPCGEKSLFCKPKDGQCGNGIFKLEIYENECKIDNRIFKVAEGKDRVLDLLKSGDYIIQTLVKQHPVIDRLYAQSINTLRLITIYDRLHNRVVPFSALLRIGANGNVVDNWAKGGLAVGVDILKGSLKKYGFYKHGYGTKVEQHPNSSVLFEGYEIPFYQEAISQACRLHDRLKDMPIIGWDIAITPEGPMFIEGNDNMEISLNQVANGGLKKEFENLI